MIRKTFFALTLALVGSSAAYAADAQSVQQVQPAIMSDAVTHVTVSGEYPSEAGPHTVIYRDWADLVG